jgi:hypothetical protein
VKAKVKAKTAKAARQRAAKPPKPAKSSRSARLAKTERTTSTARPPKAAKSRRGKAARKPSAARKTSARPASSKWLGFVEKHGVVLASARGPVPSVAEAVAGEPIVGSWWAHPKGNQIFTVLSELDDSSDVRCFKLVDGKVTLVHRKAWPALVRLGRDGVIAPEQLAVLEQEHMPGGEHRNLVTPFPNWVDDATDHAAAQLTTEQARAQLAWVEG